ncbi:arsenite methyltransferase [Candidatus Poribacteria bacterium]|nr:arsenite methyltransferase [Candidatus Poribacteria bacterium]
MSQERQRSSSCCAERVPGRSDDLRQVVREGYAGIALAEDESTGCCGASADDVAAALGYDTDDLAALPEGANLGLSCGNPTALASLVPGEVVLDLGSGAGLDVFLAARRVGPEGRAIGVDMTPEMLSKARRNADAFRDATGMDNVEFRLGEIEHLPVADASVDVVISNCVINLSPDKPQVWREIARVLKPGGRVAVSDLALLQTLPQAVAESIEALLGCVAGAVLVSETERMASDVGLVDIALESDASYMDAMADWRDPLYVRIAQDLPRTAEPSDYVTSLKITARKP